MKTIFYLLFFTNCYFLNAQTPTKVSAGSIDRIENFQSKFVTSRNVEVWLPDNYSIDKKYCVLYLQDGQMLFDAETTWNKQSWEIDETISKLIKSHTIKDVIVVAIYNGGATRHSDYFPQKPFESLTSAQQNEIFKKNRSNGVAVFSESKINSDNYLKFIVKELKPLIDKKYSVHADFKHTFIGGSSMGGLISLYAICEYPAVFGGAICMSTHWPGIFELENNPIPEAFFNYLQFNLPNPKNHKIYFDYGTETLDKMYQTLQPKADHIMRMKKYNKKNWLTRKFEGDDHNEISWQKRFYIPLEFMLSKK